MELKEPKPLGERKVATKDATKHVLDIAKEKNLEKKKKLPFPFLEKLKLPKSNKKIEKKDKESQTFKQYIATHKETVTNALFIFIPILIIIILIIVINSYVKAEPYRVAEQFLEMIEQKDIDGAYELTTGTYKVVTKENDFKEIVLKLNSVDINNRKVDKKKLENKKDIGQYAHITYKASGYYINIAMFNDTVDWGVHSIEIKPIE
ncbi:MAG TPA: hypothetical protein PLW18_00145 [Candidatus Dojkabacteria bacterium]|jgi:hypothetical protein|nr:hypothetical protein [Candidatus Dojkabacteria bacterium]